MAILCVDIGIFRAIWFIYFKWLTPSRVTIGTWFSVPLGCLQDFIFYGVSIFVSLGSSLGGLPGLPVCIFTLGVGHCGFCCLVGYLCITCARTCYGFISNSLCLPLFLFVDCGHSTLVMKFNSSARFLSAVWCVLFIIAKFVFFVGSFNASNKSCDDNVAAFGRWHSGNLQILWKHSMTSAIISDLISVVNT